MKKQFPLGTQKIVCHFKEYETASNIDATTDLGIWLNGKMVFVFGMIWQIRKINLNFSPYPMSRRGLENDRKIILDKNQIYLL